MMISRNMLIGALTVVWSCAISCCAEAGEGKGGAAARVVERPDTEAENDFHVGNRPPLLPSPFVKLATGSITPKGWLRHILELQADGMTGHMPKLSKFCNPVDNAWLSPDGKGIDYTGCEDLPYWLRGFGDLGYVLGDARIIKEAAKWIEGVISSRQPDGYFGPRTNKDDHDFWCNMLMLNCLQSYYEYSNDKRILPLMLNYCRWELKVPNDQFLTAGPRSYWQHMRGGDNLETVYWLYNRTGKRWLLDLAEKIHDNTATCTPDTVCKGSHNHGVNICQSFREPAQYYMLNKDAKFRLRTYRNYDTVMDTYGQMPGGMFAADERCEQGHDDPLHGAETCSVFEFMRSFEMLVRITGDPIWADRCEDVAFNTAPATQPPDLKSVHYLTAPNMIQLDKENHMPPLANSGCMLAYSSSKYNCCRHNVGFGWPYYAQELWLATPGNGLCASLYAPSEVRARVGDGTTIKIVEDTDYPFDDAIDFTFTMPKSVQFPLHLRIPGWCDKAEVTINGEPVSVRPKPLAYVVVDRLWSSGDVLTLRLPMSIRIKKWEANKNSVSVNRGPLTYSLRIGEKWVQFEGTREWPGYEVLPTTPWNYGLALDGDNPAGSFEVVEKTGPLPKRPFTLNGAPIELKVHARKIPNWAMESSGLVGLLKMSPAKSTEAIETITLIPMGCARLRIAAFPTVSTDPNAHQW